MRKRPTNFVSFFHTHTQTKTLSETCLRKLSIVDFERNAVHEELNHARILVLMWLFMVFLNKVFSALAPSAV
jgi:hypothetical protein